MMLHQLQLLLLPSAALSLLYLFLHFGAILAEAVLKPWGLGGW